jgi:hypothetical protein
MKQLENILASARTAWSHLHAALKIGITTGILFAAASAFVDVRTLLKDLFASPEKQLTELGYQRRTYDEFLRAIATRHVEAIELFGKLHLRLKPQHFPELFTDENFATPVLDALIASSSVNETHCPSDLKGSALYGKHSANPEKVRYLRKVCSKGSVLDSLRSSRAAEASRIAEASSSNSGRASRLEQCRNQYMAENYQALLDEAIRFNILSKTQYSQRECILAELNKSLLLGGGELARGPSAIAPFVQRCCERYIPNADVDDRGVRAIDNALKMLGAS